MFISDSIEINKTDDKIWNHLKTLEDIEEYLPIVTKLKVSGSGIGATISGSIDLNEKTIPLKETLVEFDETTKSFALFVDEGPYQIKNLVFNFHVFGKKGISEILISIESRTGFEEVKTIKKILTLLCLGVKQFYERD